MGYPIIEWIPDGHRDCSVEQLDTGRIPGDLWESKSEADDIRVQRLPAEPAWQVSPIADPYLQRALVWDQRTNDTGSWVKFENIQGGGLDVATHGSARYFIHAWMMSGGPLDGAEYLRADLETFTGASAGPTVRAEQTSAAAQTWYELHATMTVPAGVNNVRAVLAIKRTSKSSCYAIVRAGRCIDFPDGVKFDIRRNSTATQARSHGGIIQTDWIGSHDVVDVESQDIARAAFRTVQDFYDHARRGGSCGFAGDRVSRSINWSRALIAPPGSEPVVRPVGPERYRFRMKGAQGHEGDF